jgi:tetratricopeptide (TPR) repeat protein
VGSLDDVKSHFAKLGEQLGVPFGPPELIVYELGYQYLQAGRSELAVAAFRFNTEKHPQSANAWDSLAEGLERRGEVTEALAAYRRQSLWRRRNSSQTWRPSQASLTPRDHEKIGAFQLAARAE